MMISNSHFYLMYFSQSTLFQSLSYCLILHQDGDYNDGDYDESDIDDVDNGAEDEENEEGDMVCIFVCIFISFFESAQLLLYLLFLYYLISE